MAEALEYNLTGAGVPAHGGDRGGLPDFPSTATDERPLRDELRRQIAHLERQLSELWTSAFPRKGIDWSVGAAGGPRMLGSAELEQIRDSLVIRVREAQHELARRTDVEEKNRGLVERMIAEPQLYPWVQISNDDVGDRDCKHWHSRPRWGILGMLMGWWRVKLSSGCPLAEGLRPPPRIRHGEEAAQKAAPAAARGDERACAGAPAGRCRA